MRRLATVRAASGLPLAAAAAAGPSAAAAAPYRGPLAASALCAVLPAAGLAAAMAGGGWGGRRFLSYAAPAWADELREAARKVEKNISYDIKIFDELAWQRRTFAFQKDHYKVNELSRDQRQRLCLGDEHREYTVIGEAFLFPDKHDSPVINEPAAAARLLWDHTSPTVKLLVQLGPAFPPLLWIAVKPTLAAVQRVFREFLDIDAEHMKSQLAYYEAVQSQTEALHGEKFGDGLADFKMRDRFTDDMRQRDPATLGVDYEAAHQLYLGNVDHLTSAENDMLKLNPFVFGWPLLLSYGNHHQEDTPTKIAAFRTIFSKSQILLTTRGDMHVDPASTRLGAEEEEAVVLEVPLYASVVYKPNQRMCGGSALVDRFNKTMGTSFPLDTPVDVLGAFCASHGVKGEAELMTELRFLAAAAEKVPDVERVIRVAPQMTGANRILGQLAFCICHLAEVARDDATWVREVFEPFSTHSAGMVRAACARGAATRQLADCVAALLAVEPEGRTRQMMEIAMEMARGSAGPESGEAPAA